MKKREILELTQAGYDLDFLASVQPQGNLKRYSRYLEMGDGYVTCLRLNKYPQHGLMHFWGVPLTNNDSTMAVISLGTEDRAEILKQLSRSATEQKIRISGKAKELDNVQSGGTYMDQLRLMSQLSQANEVMKRVYMRIFVYAPTLPELEKRVKMINRDNGQFGMARYADEQLSDFESIFIPTMHEQDMLNKPQGGLPIQARSIAGSYPFNHVKLEDPNGSYYGYTRTSGEVMFDPFQRDKHRTRSFFFVTGNAGMGKSTLLKKMNDDVFSRGAYIRNFDVSGEYTDQTRHQNGVIIKLDQPENMINPFEVFPTVVNDNGSVDEINSFAQHVTKLKNFFKFLSEDANSDDMTMLDSWIQDFYIDQNLWVRNPQQNINELQITGRSKDEYPTLRDFVLYANERQRKAERDPRIHLTSNMVTSMNRITSTFSNILETKGDMFEGPTRLKDMSNDQVVTFNIQGLLAQGEQIFNAQIYSVLTLLSADIIKNGMKLRKQLKNGTLDMYSIPWYYLNIDEVENIISPKFTFGVEFLASMMEQMRKNFCAITMAAPTIKDLIMNGDSHDPYILAVQKIFSLFQIRFFFQISDDDLPRLQTALGGSTTLDELQSLTQLEKTECLMNINGDRNIQFKVEITAKEKQRYGGGI